VCLLLTAFKLWLTSSQTISAIGPSNHDDLHFITQAQHLLNGAWLGPYDQFTLIKGPFFPAWIALAYSVGLPLLISAQLLYAIACWCFTVAVQPVLRRMVYTPILFGFLLFNPQSTGALLTRVIREMISPALTLVLAACAVGLLLRQKQPERMTWFWAAGLGLSLGALWLTREEGPVVLPFLGFILGAAAVSAWADRGRRGWRLPMFKWLIALSIGAAIVVAVCAINRQRYGVFAKTEFDAASYRAAYGALSRVKPLEFKRYVPVSKKTRQLIYRVSPAFAELKPYIEGIPGSYWEAYSESQQDDSNRHEILAGWFSWALRDAVSEAGYYGKGAYPDSYYRRLADEVNTACKDGLVECYAPRATLIPVWHNAYIRQLIPRFGEKLVEAATFQGVGLIPRPSEGTPEQLALFRQLTHTAIIPVKVPPQPGSADDPAAGQPDRSILHRATLAFLLRIYRLVNPALAVVALLFYGLLTITVFRQRKQVELWLLLTGLLLLWSSRTGLVALIDVTSWRISAGEYLHEAYAPMLSFIAVACLAAVERLEDVVALKRHMGAGPFPRA
jgi:hypothetical protein